LAGVSNPPSRPGRGLRPLDPCFEPRAGHLRWAFGAPDALTPRPPLPSRGEGRIGAALYLACSPRPGNGRGAGGEGNCEGWDAFRGRGGLRNRTVERLWVSIFPDGKGETLTLSLGYRSCLRAPGVSVPRLLVRPSTDGIPSGPGEGDATTWSTNE